MTRRGVSFSRVWTKMCGQSCKHLQLAEAEIDSEGYEKRMLEDVEFSAQICRIEFRLTQSTEALSNDLNTLNSKPDSTL